jgi:hypothetical protein
VKKGLLIAHCGQGVDNCKEEMTHDRESNDHYGEGIAH